MLGDPNQLRPLLTVDRKTMQGQSIFHLPIVKSLTHFSIKSQFRCDAQYLQFLGNHFVLLYNMPIIGGELLLLLRKICFQ